MPKAAELLNLADLESTGFSRTVARDHSGMDWTRSIIWAKDAYFVVIDELAAQEAGEYKMGCLWRTLGEGVWEGPVFRTRQAPSASGEVRDDSEASGGKVMVLEGGMLGVAVHMGEGEYGAYIVGSGSDDGSNSVWVEVDGKRLPAFHLPERKLGSVADPSDDASLIPFRIERGGTHRFTISLRERPPVRLDRLVIRSMASGEETVLEVEAFRDSVEGRVDEFFLESVGADRVDVEAADRKFLRFWSDYRHARPMINVVNQMAIRSMAQGDRHRFMTLFYASNDQDPRDYRLRSVDEACALIAGDPAALVGSGALNREGLELEADLYRISAEGFALVGGRRFHAGRSLFESEAPVSVELDLATGKGIVIADAATSIGLPSGTTLEIDGSASPGVEKDGLIWAQIEAGRYEIAVEGIADAARAALRDAFEAIAASARDTSPETSAGPAPGDKGLRELWRYAGEGATAELAIGDVDGRPVVYAGTGDGQVRALGETGALLWTYDAGSPVTALHVPGGGGLLLGTEDSQVCWLDAAGGTRWSIQFSPLHPSLRYRAPSGESDIGAIYAAGEDEAILFVGVANGWFRALDGGGEQLWEHFGNSRAFDQIAVGDLDGTGEPFVVGTGNPSHFGTCVSFDMAGDQKANNGIDGWARVSTQMRVDDIDGDGRDEVICGTALGNLYLLRGAGLETDWMEMLGDEITDLATIGPKDDRRIVAASQSYYVYSVDSDGGMVWSSNLGDRVTQVCGLNRTGRSEIAAACEGGRIVVLEAGDGRPLAQYSAPAGIVALSAADLDGDGEDEIVAGLADGSVIVLKR